MRWNASTAGSTWCGTEINPTGSDSFGVYFDVPVDQTAGTPAGQLGFIINNCAAGQIKDPGPDQHLQTTQYQEAWVIHANATVFTTQPTARDLRDRRGVMEWAFDAKPAESRDIKLGWRVRWPKDKVIQFTPQGS